MLPFELPWSWCPFPAVTTTLSRQFALLLFSFTALTPPNIVASFSPYLQCQPHRAHVSAERMRVSFNVQSWGQGSLVKSACFSCSGPKAHFLAAKSSGWLTTACTPGNDTLFWSPRALYTCKSYLMVHLQHLAHGRYSKLLLKRFLESLTADRRGHRPALHIKKALGARCTRSPLGRRESGV